MSFKKVRYLNYIADNASDLALIPEAEIGTACYVIEEAAEYRLTSKGRWVKQIPPSAGANGSTDIDLSGYATEDYVNNAIAGIEHPTVDLSSYATKEYTDAKAREVSNKIPSLDGYAMTVEVEAIKSNPVFKMFSAENVNNANLEQYGIYIKNTDNKTLVEAMKEKGLGFYNFFLQKGCDDLPQKMKNDNSSGHGICCVDYYVNNGEDWAGYIMMLNKNNEMYYRYISHAVAGSWMKISAEEA